MNQRSSLAFCLHLIEIGWVFCFVCLLKSCGSVSVGFFFLFGYFSIYLCLFLIFSPFFSLSFSHSLVRSPFRQRRAKAQTANTHLNKNELLVHKRKIAVQQVAVSSFHTISINFSLSVAIQISFFCHFSVVLGLGPHAFVHYFFSRIH